ncbi:hypothetical protein ON010_g16041 [Phytophthora cinnamomi]|nr:hypothetical protein ON010_g16041 [Phytophthora cinnamomi]
MSASTEETKPLDHPSKRAKQLATPPSTSVAYSGRSGRRSRHTQVECPSRRDMARTGRDRPEALLASGVPDLQFYPLAVHVDRLDLKVDAAGQNNG